MKKRILSLILIFALVFSLCSSAFAAQSSTGEVTVTLPTIINPLYADLISAEDLPVQQAQKQNRLKYSATPCDSVEEAGALLRSAMVQHTETIEFSISADASVSPQDLSDSILDAAFVHTGAPREGDYLRWQYYSCSPSCSYVPGGSIITYDFTYDFVYLTTTEQENELDSAAAALLEQLDLDGKSDYDKVSAIYGYVCSNVSYDYETLYTSSYILKYSAYAALINKTAVCQGYATLMYMLLLTEGIDCRIVTSANHAWNIVKLGSLYYNLDATYDSSRLDYAYFLFGEDTYSDSDHTREAPYNAEPFVSDYPTSSANYSANAASHTHSYTDTVVESSCEAAGYTLHSCSCGLSYKDSVTAATGHRLVNDACVYCGRKSTPSESDVYDAMIALKDEYPEGLGWTNSNRYAWNGSNSVGYGCVAFAYILSDAAFGTLPAREYHDSSLARVGDILRMNGHSVIILEVHSDHFIVAEGNYNNSVHWGRSISRATVEASLEYAQTRYQLTDEVDPDLHTHAYTDIVTAPTCTEGGYTTHSCVCGDSYVDSYVDALGHDTVLRDKRSATCTRDGYTGDETCLVCNRIVQGGSTIPALGHDYENGVCTRCGSDDPDYQPTHSHSYINVVTAPTCTGQGYTMHSCDCGDSYIDSYVDALGHDYKNGVCTRCGEKDAGYVPPHTHSYTDKITAPTCTDKGYTTHSCDCGETYVDSYVAALGHNYKDGVCTRCGADDPGYVPPHTHAYTDKVTAPTCTDKGYTTHTCDCGDSYVDSYVAALGHNYKNGICTVCGAADPNYKEPTPVVSFTDVPDSAYYAKAVAWAVANDITGGYPDGTFRPMNVCTRAQIVTFIWRANGSPEPAGTAKGFNDVFEGTYYYKAVLWAAEKGITGGFGDGGFHPDELVTRAQAMTFLWRANDKPAVPAGTVNTFKDVSTSNYYYDAVLWAVANGITGGYDSTTFGSPDGCTRAQIVTFLYRASTLTQEPEPEPTEAELPSLGDEPTRENVLALLDKYDPDGAFIVRTDSDNSLLVWFGRGLFDDLGMAVHEELHSYSYSDMLNGELYYIGDGSAIRVVETETYLSEEMAAQIPAEYRTSRYDTYIAAGSDVSANLSGIYGLMNEFTAYCWGCNTDVALYDYFLTLPVTTDIWQEYIGIASGSYPAYAEFKYYILSYMLYARDNYPDIYEELLANTALMNAFKTVEAKFSSVVDKYFENLDHLERLLTENGFTAKHADGYFWIYSGYTGQGTGTNEDSYYLLVEAMEAPEYVEMYETLLSYAG